MHAPTLLVLLAAAAVMLAVLIQPFVVARRRPRRRALRLQPAAQYRLRADLLAERRRVLQALAALEERRKAGAIDAAGYAGERARLVARGARALRWLDALDGLGPGAQDPVEETLETMRRRRSP